MKVIGKMINNMVMVELSMVMPLTIKATGFTDASMVVAFIIDLTVTDI